MAIEIKAQELSDKLDDLIQFGVKSIGTSPLGREMIKNQNRFVAKRKYFIKAVSSPKQELEGVRRIRTTIGPGLLSAKLDELINFAKGDTILKRGVKQADNWIHIPRGDKGGLGGNMIPPSSIHAIRNDPIAHARHEAGGAPINAEDIEGSTREIADTRKMLAQRYKEDRWADRIKRKTGKRPFTMGFEHFKLSSKLDDLINFSDPRPRNPLGEFANQQEGVADPNSMATTYKSGITKGIGLTGAAVLGGAGGTAGSSLVKALIEKAKKARLKK
jgi:hypothetical protein